MTDTTYLSSFDLEQYEAREAAFFAAAPQPGPCPEWCSALEGHAFDSGDLIARTFSRSHTTEASGAKVWLTQHETLSADTGQVVELAPVEICMDYELGTNSITSADVARSLAVELLAAADKLEDIA